MSNQYPRMLYKPEGGQHLIWGYYLDTLIVDSEEEEKKALKRGWLKDPNAAVVKAKRIEKRSEIKAFFIKHWQFWLTFLVSLLGLAVGFLNL